MDYFTDYKLLSDNFLKFKGHPKKKIIDEILEILIRNDLSINTIILHGYSLLHVTQGKKTMKYLIDLKGDVNLQNTYGITPIFTQKSHDTIELLIKNGVNPNCYDNNNFTPLYWQKDPDAMELLVYNYGLDLANYNHLFTIEKEKTINDIYCEMLIHGGYDPYNEFNICISPLFVQRNILTQEIMLLYEPFNRYYHTDIFLETPLFKLCITKDLLELYLYYGTDINHQNMMGNTLLFVHNDLKIIESLLFHDINLTLRNYNNETAYIYHMKRNNYHICSLIKTFYSSRLIQRNWKIYMFKKTYIPIKNFKKKKELVEYINILPPSLCGLFPGGIIYQDSLNDFIQHLPLLSC